jgi:hypothetical protein
LDKTPMVDFSAIVALMSLLMWRNKAIPVPYSGEFVEKKRKELQCLYPRFLHLASCVESAQQRIPGLGGLLVSRLLEGLQELIFRYPCLGKYRA